VRTFIDHGLPMQRLLREATSRGIASDYAASLLAEYPTELQEEKQPTSSQDDSPWIEPLTESELSIVRLMAAGLSNREIADELFLSVNTIKVYASRAYAKLGVHRRGEAVALAREYDLI
jgi:LuxR family maltose regulon positive regulatory protein